MSSRSMSRNGAAGAARAGPDDQAMLGRLRVNHATPSFTSRPWEVRICRLKGGRGSSPGLHQADQGDGYASAAMALTDRALYRHEVRRIEVHVERGPTA